MVSVHNGAVDVVLLVVASLGNELPDVNSGGIFGWIPVGDTVAASGFMYVNRLYTI